MSGSGEALPPDLEARLPRNAPVDSAQYHLAEGARKLYSGDLDAASRHFNRGLKYVPENPNLNFLNAFIYHLRSEAGNQAQADLAEVGYRLTLKFDPAHWLAAYQLGRLHFARREYTSAQSAFAQVLLLRPQHPGAAHAFAAASYYAQDPATALAVLDGLPEPPAANREIVLTKSMIYASLGRPEEAVRGLSRYRALGGGQVETARLRQRIEDWNRFHRYLPPRQAKSGQMLAQMPGPMLPPGGPGTPPGPPGPGPAPTESGRPKMAILDVVLIARDDAETSTRGINILDALKLQFSGAILDYTRTRSRNHSDSTENSHRQVGSFSITIPAVTYSLNIANSADSVTRLIARPSVVAYDGVESEVFLGAELTYATGGQFAASFTKEVGLKLTARPQFAKSGDRLLLTVNVQVDAFSPSAAPGTFDQAVATVKNRTRVTAEMGFDQTLVIAGGTQHQESDVRSGVPGLQRVPVLQYFFGTRGRSETQSSLLVLLTPRRPAVSEVVTSADQMAADLRRRRPDLTPEALRQLRGRYEKWMRQHPTLVDVAHNLAGVNLYGQFREGDIRFPRATRRGLTEPGRTEIPDVLREFLMLLHY